MPETIRKGKKGSISLLYFLYLNLFTRKLLYDLIASGYLILELTLSDKSEPF